MAGALGIALVSLADTMSTASAFAARTGQEVHGNREMAGIGAANLAAGFFQGFPVSTSGSRTAVAERAGARTQIAGLTGAVAHHRDDRAGAGVVPEPAAARARRCRHHRLDLAGGHPRHAPTVASAPDGVRCCRSRLSSGSPCSAYSSGSRPRWRCRSSTFSAAPGGRTRPSSDGWTASRGFHDVRSYPQAEHLPGLVIYRFDAPLLFANARTFRDEVRRMAATEPQAALDPARCRADH